MIGELMASGAVVVGDDQVCVTGMSTSGPPQQQCCENRAITGDMSRCYQNTIGLLPKIPVYTGEPEDCSLEHFISAATEVLTLHQVPDCVDTEFVFQHLGGRARRVLVAHPYEESCTPAAIFQILRKAFGEPPLLPRLSKPYKKYQKKSKSRW